MDLVEAQEKKMRKMKKNLKLLAVALVVLAIEKIAEFFTAIFETKATAEPTCPPCNATWCYWW
jgi:hypothetical protein